MKDNKMVLGATLGNCVHVAGVLHFLQIAEEEGYRISFLGPSIPIDVLMSQIELCKPSLVAVSYRLTPENVVPILDELVQKSAALSHHPRWVFGGTRPVAELARRYGFFSYISDGFDEAIDSIRFLRG